MSAENEKDEKVVESDIYNFCRLPGELDKVTDGGGAKVMTQLFLTYFLYCKAMSRDWIQNTFNVYYLNVLFADSNITNIMYTVYATPFGVKTLWGSLSDAMPCLGYHKKYYILWGVSVSIVCASLLAMWWPEGEFSESRPASSGVIILVTLLFFGFDYGNATVDSLTQARYTELMKMMGKPVIVSFVWFLMNSCTLFSSLGNIFVKEGAYKILLWPAVMFALPMIVPASLNWLAEPKADNFCKPACGKVTKNKGCFLLAIFLAVAALTGSGLVLAFADSDNAQLNILLPYYLAVGIIFIVASKFVLHRDIWGPAVYMFLCSSLTLYFFGTQQGFYTFRNAAGMPAELEDPCINGTARIEGCKSYCLEDLPGFSTAYYQTVGQLLGAVAAVIAVLIFDQVIVTWKTRPAFWITCVFKMVATILELMIIERWNHKLFGTTPGLPENMWVDQWFFMVGAQAVYKIVDMLDFMPFNVLIGNMCPPGMEATIFAVLAGSQNFGQTIATMNGGILMNFMGVVYTKNYNECANPHLPWFFGMTAFGFVRTVAGVFLPAITIPLTFILLPDKKLSEKYVFPEDDELELSNARELTNAQGDMGGFAAGDAGERPRSASQGSNLGMSLLGKTSGSRIL